MLEGVNMKKPCSCCCCNIRGLQCMKQGVRIVLMGSALVGKTAIIKRFLYSMFDGNYTETIEDMYRTSFNSCQMDILDTTGSYYFPVMQDYAIATGDVFVLVFSWSDRASFEYLQTLLDKIRAIKHSTAKIIVVANKMDMDDTATRFAETELIVSVDWDCLFHQCSAKDDTHITALFEKIVDMIRGKKYKLKQHPGLIRSVSRRLKKMMCSRSGSFAK